MPEKMPSQEIRPNRRRLIVLAVLVLALAGVLVVALDWSEVRQLESAARWYMILPSLFFAALSYASLGYIFVVLNRLFGVELKKRDLFEIGFVSVVLGHLLSFAGLPQYALRLLLMRPRGVAAGQILAPSIFGEYLNSVAMLALFPIGIAGLLITGSLSGRQTGSLVVTLAAFASLFVVASALVFSGWLRIRLLRGFARLWLLVSRRDIAGGMETFDAALRRGIGSLRWRSGGVALLAALVVLDWAATVLALEFCFLALGTSPGLGVLVIGFATGITAGALSMMPGGLGVQEGSMAGIYALLGIPFDQAILASVLFRVIYYLVPFAVSLAFYRRLLKPSAPTAA